MRERLIAETDAALQHWSGLPFAWGLSDCALAVADIYRIALGIDPAEAWRGRYRDEAGARAVLGKGNLRAAMGRSARRLGWARIAPAAARPGDLGLIRSVLGPACAIRHREFWAARGDRGFSLVTDRAVLAAWAVAGSAGA